MPNPTRIQPPAGERQDKPQPQKPPDLQPLIKSLRQAPPDAIGLLPGTFDQGSAVVAAAAWSE